MKLVKRILLLFGTIGILFCMYSYLQEPVDSEIKLNKEEEKENDNVDVIRNLENRINKVQSDVVKNRSILNQMFENLTKLKDIQESQKRSPTLTTKKIIDNNNNEVNINNNINGKIIIPIMVIAFNRPSVSRCLDLIFKYKPYHDNIELPVIVSQDGYHTETANVIKGYGDKLHHIQHDNSGTENIPKNQRNLIGYYKLSAHFKWAFNEVFSLYPSASSVIILEDDLDISPDFFSYFLSTHKVLVNDESLLCVSAWNDNGKSGLIDEGKSGETLLYRTDFFPGLGWMITKKVWEELKPTWPDAFWDDWLRLPEQRKNRACIRPEVSRSMTFGKVGVSKGQFFEKHLKFIKLNQVDVDWSKIDLSYLKQENYDKKFLDKVYNLPEISLNEISQQQSGNECRLVYTSLQSFKNYVKTLGLMEDLKAGVPRTAYKGIVTIFYKNLRIYITPRKGWTGYNTTWK